MHYSATNCFNRITAREHVSSLCDALYGRFPGRDAHTQHTGWNCSRQITPTFRSFAERLNSFKRVNCFPVAQTYTNITTSSVLWIYNTATSCFGVKNVGKVWHRSYTIYVMLCAVSKRFFPVQGVDTKYEISWRPCVKNKTKRKTWQTVMIRWGDSMVDTNI